MRISKTKNKTDEEVMDLCDKLTKIIKGKDELNKDEVIDKEVLAYISVFKHGSFEYKERAKKWIIEFCHNAGVINNE